MKKLLFLLIFFLPAISKAQATVTLPVATVETTVLTWTNSSTCTTSTPCVMIPYRIGGTCPSTLGGTSGWTQLATTASQAVTATDTSVVPGSTYSYVVESVFVSGGANSGPSNCVTVTIPNVPAAPTGLTAAG